MNKHEIYRFVACISGIIWMWKHITFIFDIKPKCCGLKKKLNKSAT